MLNINSSPRPLSALPLFPQNRRPMANLIKRTFSTFKIMQRLTMNSMNLPEIFQPPVNRSMQDLDRSFFKKVVPTSKATVLDPKQISKVRSVLTSSHELLLVTGVRPVVEDETGAKSVVLRPEVKAEQPGTWSSQLTQLVDERTVEIKPYELILTYDNWTMSNILEAILPELPEDQKETPAGFAQVGHIAHVNLRSQYLPWKTLIGQVLLDKNPQLRTVINKTLDVGSESEFRTFPYEILAGDRDLDVIQSEQGCEFRFNFAEVYWNSRLGTEHERLVAKFQPGEAVCDVMAGVGPFAIPAGKKRVFVEANDLNPHSFDGLKWAIQRNKVYDFVNVSCMDGRAFIKDATRRLAEQPRTVDIIPNIKIPRSAPLSVVQELTAKKFKEAVTYKEPRSFDHYVMNLPASAVEFLDSFNGLLVGRENEFHPHTTRKLPMIHVYTFQARRDTGDEEVREVCDKVSKYLNSQINPGDNDAEISDSRLVSPKKKYYRATFRLPADIAFANKP